MKYGYIRVSTKEQNIDRQLNSMYAQRLDKKIFLLINKVEKILIEMNIKN